MQYTPQKWTIKKILNNSSIVVADTIREYIVISKGIGFGKKIGDILPKGTAIERLYRFSPQAHQLSRITDGYDEQIITMVMDTIELIVAFDNNRLKTTDFLSLSDHLAASYTRILNNEAIQSFFSYEIQALYPESFSDAQSICEQIERKHNISIPIAEVSYIGLHIQNLRTDETEHSVETLSAIISEIYNLLTYHHGYSIQSSDLNYLRFITHLRFLVEGKIQKKKKLTSTIIEAFQDSYPEYSTLTDEIIAIIEELLDTTLATEEKMYILIHVINMIDDIAK